MGSQLLRTESNERIDIGDWTQATVTSVDQAQRALTERMLSIGSSYVISGFNPTFSPNTSVQLTAGTAMLAYREGITYKTGLVATVIDGKTVAIGTYPNGTYGIFIRFDYNDTDLQSRVFWNANPTPGAETLRSVNTRKTIGWSVRIEASTPGPEYLQIGTCTIAGGVVTGITKQRKFYFEGDEATSFAAAWGNGVNDRNSDRVTNGITDLQTTLEAMRAQFSSLFGGAWYNRNVKSTSVAGGIGIQGLGFNTSSVGLLGSVGASQGEIDTQVVTNFPGAGIIGITKTSGLPAIVGANIGAAGPGVWGTSANGAGVYGTASAAAPGGVFAGNGQSIATALAAGAGSGLVGYSNSKAGIYGLGNDVPGVMAEADSTTPVRGALHMVPLTGDPSTPVEGDYWHNSTLHEGSLYNGTEKRRISNHELRTVVAASSSNATAIHTVFSNGTFNLAALQVGRIIEIEARFDAVCTAGSQAVNVVVRIGTNLNSEFAAATYTSAATGTHRFCIRWLLIYRGSNVFGFCGWVGLSTLSTGTLTQLEMGEVTAITSGGQATVNIMTGGTYSLGTGITLRDAIVTIR